MFGVGRRKRAAALAVAGLAAASVTLAAWPARRLIGIDRVVTEHTLPAWIKAVDFVHRDLNLGRTARDVLEHVDGDEARALAALLWTSRHVRRQPGDFPVVDDHVWHIIVRGYGEPDQQADVFTTLLAYEGIDAYWGLIGTPPHELPLSYVRIDEKWRVFDVAHQIVFRTEAGGLATPEDLSADTRLVRRAADGRVADFGAYAAYFRGYRPPRPPDVLRADLQMAGRRLLHEMRSVVGAGGRVWQIRPEPATPEGVSIR